MAERNHDDIAAALHGLSAGDSSAETGAGEVVDDAGATPSPTAPPPAAGRPTAARPVAPGASPRPSQSGRPAAAAGRPSPPARPQGASPASARPSVPQLQRQAAPPAARPIGPARPAAPGTQQAYDASREEVAPTEPPAAIDYRSAPRRPAPRPQFFKTLGFRRTSIPVLLSTGAMMLAMALLRFFVDEASPMAMLPTWTTVLLFIAGPLLILLGLANMLQVKKELELKR